MCCSKQPPFILLELPDLTESINFPLRNVQRIKYSCFDVSKSLIAFGATSGGIYVFSRARCEFVQLIPNKDGTITRLCISPNEKHIGFANGRGIVTVTECVQSLSGSHSTVTSKEHSGNEVTTMVWSSGMLVTGDDIGRVSVLQLQSFIAKTMFKSSSQTIMNLDSRICQLDIRDNMLLVSTLSRCYICDTSLEQYRQIGQKLRDGGYGACFVNDNKSKEHSPVETTKDLSEVKTFNIVDDDTGFAVSKELQNTVIYCARPSSRLWEASIDGTVKRTHQFKQVLARKPMKVFTLESYNNENMCLNDLTVEGEGQSINFAKLFNINGAIFSYKRDALYFLNVQDVDSTIWVDAYNDIVDCKVYHDTVYIWFASGSFKSLKFMKIDKFLVKCFFDEKYVACAELCALFSNYLLNNTLSPKLHILVGLADKLENNELLSKIYDVLKRFETLKSDAIQLKSGIFVVDNTYLTQTSISDDNFDSVTENNMISTKPPETLQTLKELSNTVTDKFTSSKKMFKEKWDDFEDKIKHLGSEKHPQEVDLPEPIARDDKEYAPLEFNADIIYKQSSQPAIEVDKNNVEKEDLCKSLFKYFRLSVVDNEMDESNLISLIETITCDINEIYKIMLLLEQYCISVGALDESKLAPRHIFLTYLNNSKQRSALLDSIIEDEILYKYFVDCCITVNMKAQKLLNLGCECGYPLPYVRTKHTPEFSELIDEFIEKQWLSQSRTECYEICKKMPYLWRKILYLRRNEDLLNVLRILLQMLDESLLHTFLPQFTLDSWSSTIQLYSTLHANICLNCNKKFDHISVKETLSWDDLGALIIKSIGGRNAIKVMAKHADLIKPGDLSMRFYHTCMMVALYEKYDATITAQLTDAIYNAYDEESSQEIGNLLKTANGDIKNTALPIVVAAKSHHWGLSPMKSDVTGYHNNQTLITSEHILQNLNYITNSDDCMLCGLPLSNIVLIKDGGLWVYKCGHTFHGACLNLNKIKLCPSCSVKNV